MISIANQNRAEKMLDVTVGEFCFALGLVAWLFFSVLSTSFYYAYFEGTLFTAIRCASLGLMCLGGLWDDFSPKSFLGIGIIAVITFVMIHAHAGLLADGFIIAFFARSHPFERVAKLCLLVIVAAFCLVVISSLLGVIDDYVHISQDRVRHYLGFRYALWPALYMFMITALVAYVRNQRLSLLDVVILVACNAWVFSMCVSRLSFGLSVFTIISAFFLAKFHRLAFLKKLIAVLALPSFVFFCLASVWITSSYDPSISWMYELNGYLDGRLRLGHDAIQAYGIPILGQSIQFVGAGLDSSGELDTTIAYNYVDCMYVRALVQYGLVFLVLLLGLLTMSMVAALKRGDYFYLLIQFVLAAHGVIDDLTLRPYFNVFLFAVGALLVYEYVHRASASRGKRAGSPSCSDDPSDPLSAEPLAVVGKRRLAWRGTGEAAPRTLGDSRAAVRDGRGRRP